MNRLTLNCILKNTLVTVVALLCFTMLDAQGIVTDRPDQTESSSTVPKRSIQIESGVLVGFTDGFKTSDRQILAPTTLFRIGVMKGWELRVVSQLEHIKSVLGGSLGLTDLELGTKVNLLQNQNINAEMAVLSHLIVPSGNKRHTGDQWGVVNKLSISHTLNDVVGLGYNIGYDHLEKGQGNLTFSLALGWSITDKVSVYAEPYGEWTEFEEWVVNADAGFTYLIHDNLQFDFSFGVGITDRMNYVSTGISWLMQRKE